MKKYSMSSHNRRKHQRWLNAICREVNKSIENDSLWRGRFVVEQKATQMEWFEDGSGGILYCWLQFRDKKTGKTKDWGTDALNVNWHIYWEMNNFIVKDCAVWEKEKPYEDITDYRNMGCSSMGLRASVL